MKIWTKVLAGAIPGASILLLLLLFLCSRCRRRRQFISDTTAAATTTIPAAMAAAKSRDQTSNGFQLSGIGARLHHLSYKSTSASKASLRFHHLHHLHNHSQEHHPHPPSPFSWHDHPHLIAQAADNGWSRFVFTHRPSAARPAWGFCVICDGGRPPAAELGWEVPAGSSEFMQTVRITPPPPASTRRSSGNNNSADDLSSSASSSSCCITMSLPLPGPPLGGSSFPQEAYFEITILYLQPRHRRLSRASKRSKDGHGGREVRAKLDEDNSPILDTDTDTSSAHLESNSKNPALVSLGLSTGASPPSKSSTVPGAHPGSIGFHSDGSVYLDGMKLVSETEKAEWGDANKVIGCGFEPGKKKVYFTVDSQLVHVFRCNSDAFENPLYPVLASNSDVMVLVNLGQAAFKYAPANALRTPNPCFSRLPLDGVGGAAAAAAGISYDDSRELFSMGRLDSEWHDGAQRHKGHGNGSSNVSINSSKKGNGALNDPSVAVDIDAESDMMGESDLFEIALNG